MSNKKPYDRDPAHDANADWETVFSKNVTPIDPKLRRLDGEEGSLLRISFYKTYGRAKDKATGEIITSVNYLCHEFPFFGFSFPDIYENSISNNWRRFRELLYRYLIMHIHDASPEIMEHFLMPKENRWLDEYSTYVLLR